MCFTRKTRLFLPFQVLSKNFCPTLDLLTYCRFAYFHPWALISFQNCHFSAWLKSEMPCPWQPPWAPGSATPLASGRVCPPNPRENWRQACMNEDPGEVKCHLVLGFLIVLKCPLLLTTEEAGWETEVLRMGCLHELQKHIKWCHKWSPQPDLQSRTPEAITIFTWKLICFVRFGIVKTLGWRVKIVITTGRVSKPAEWIKIYYDLCEFRAQYLAFRFISRFWTFWTFLLSLAQFT